MLLRKLFPFLIGFCCVGPVVSFGATSLTEPEYAGIVAAWNPTIGQMIQLERESPVRKEGHFASALLSVRLEVAAEHSPVRIGAGQNVKFIVRALSREKDPISTIQFYSLDMVDGTRQLPLAHYSFVGIADQSVRTAHQISFDATKYGEHSFLITPRQPLAPGEYMLGADGTEDGFCFGVDAPAQ